MSHTSQLKTERQNPQIFATWTAVDLRKAKASCSELEYAILLSHDLGLCAAETVARMSADTVEVRKMIHGLLRKM
jgi:four helix bundle protein